ncbi:MAG: rhodanese-like domain-containing protein [Geothrix sp.]|uniref:rhodanese-like domain-containing protein n=1 Tax=Geothrix sp. TaxID=1962974 RepID=UPI003BAFAB75
MSLLLDHWYYLLPLAAIGYLWWSRRSASATDVQALLGRNAQVVDVRTRSEFKAGAHSKAINIPLGELEGRVRELDQARPVLVCCETGSRSGFAVSLLKRAGFTEVANLGSWRRLSNLLS